MTQEEKELRLQHLNEQQFKLKEEIERGDEHAIKCIKFGYIYSERYPQEYEAYIVALKAYNDNEAEIQELQTIEIDDHYEQF